MKLHLPPTLRLPAALFLGALLLGGIAFHLALETRSASEAAYLAAGREDAAARRDLAQIPERLARDRAQAATRAQLQAAGFTGEEDRLDWIGTLARLQNDLQLERLTWRLAPREASNLGPGLRRSRMEIDLAPVDSTRLSQFFDQLRRQARGRYTLHACTLMPEAGRGVATCSLDWWTWHDH